MTAITESNTLTKVDLLIGSGIALAMATVFVNLSSGRSLIVTFVPGVVFAWLTFLWLFVGRVALPRSEEFLPVFFATLGIQFLHFAEEYLTDFKTFFPTLYGGAAFGNELFVSFNMASYAIFTFACLLAIHARLRFFLIPVLFFVIYGAIGNAVSHTWWTFDAQAYRPGFFTAQAYWVAGPLVLYKLLGNALQTGAVVVAFGAVLVALISTYAVG